MIRRYKMAAKKGYNTEAIIRKFRQAEVMLYKGTFLQDLLKGLDVKTAYIEPGSPC